APLEERIDGNAGRKGGADVRYALLHRVDDLAGVGVLEHHDLSEHLFALAVARDRAEAGRMTEADVGDILDSKRHAVTCLDHDLVDVSQRGDQPFAANK